MFPNPAAHNKPERILDEKLAVQADLIFVAMDKDTVVGSVIAGYDGHRGWLNLLAVSVEYRKRGVGAMLVEHAVKELNLLGCHKVNIQIREGNNEVQQFYEKLGFAVEPRTSMGKHI